MAEGANARSSCFASAPQLSFDVSLHTSQSIIETAPKFPELLESSTACLHEQGNTERYQHASPWATAVQLYERYGMHQEKAVVQQKAGLLQASRLLLEPCG
jgi:hypothetical protein